MESFCSLKYNFINHIVNYWGIFCFKETRVYSQTIFSCLTLERIPPPFYLIRHEPMVEEYHQFDYCGGIFCFKETQVYSQAIFACPTLERIPPPFYLIRQEPMVEELTKLVVLFNHWFMPYKVERGRNSFQCGTSKNCLGVHMSFL